MIDRLVAATRTLVFGIAALGLAAPLAAGQAPGQTSSEYSSSSTPWGDPDLQGMWDTRP